MRRLLVAAAVLAVMLVPAIAGAQSGNFDMRYDPQSVQTITGTVLTTINYNPSNPAAGPMSAVVQSGNQVYTVFLGPGSYVSQTGLSLKQGDQISVVGSMRNINGNNFLVASTVTSGSQTYKFRSDNGTPLWATANAPIGAGPNPNVPVGAGANPNVPIGAGAITQTNPQAGYGAIAPQVGCSQPGCGATCPQNCPLASSATPCPTCQQMATCGPVCPPVGCGPVCPPQPCGVCGTQLVLDTVPFNSNDIITVSGRIESITQVQSTCEGTEPIIQVTTVPSTGYNRRSVILLGPCSYITQCGINIAQGSEIWVRGSLVNTCIGKRVVATDLRQGGAVISVRSITGYPAWFCAGAPGGTTSPVVY